MVGPDSALLFGALNSSLHNHGLSIVRLLCAVLAVAAVLSPPAAAALPNIVLIVADDLGYGEVGIHHQGDIPTPNIDAIGRAGVTFSDGYVTAPVCVPSRFGLMIGRYPQELGIHDNPPNPVPANFGMPAKEITLAEALRARGYATGLIGKWDLGYDPPHYPQLHGFDEFFGVLNAGHPYFGEQPGNPIMRGTTVVPASGYLTDTLATEAVKFIRRHAGSPFFLDASFTATHTPLQAKPDVLARLSYIADPKRRLFAGVLVSLDEAVGRISAALRSTGVSGNTMVVFLGDNGCNSCRNKPLRGGKRDLYEGGIRVPMMLSWPGRVARGSIYARPVMSFDLFVTMLRAGGGRPAAVVDGVDLLPFLQGATGDPHEALFWTSIDHTFGAIRQGRWKLVDGQLYDLQTDIGERRDLATTKPTLAADLAHALALWRDSLPPPAW